MRMRFTASIVPDELPAAIICTWIFIISNPITLLWTKIQELRQMQQEKNKHRIWEDKLKTIYVHGLGTCCLWWPIQSALPPMWWPSPRSTKRLNPHRMYNARSQTTRRRIAPAEQQKGQDFLCVLRGKTAINQTWSSSTVETIITTVQCDNIC